VVWKETAGIAASSAFSMAAGNWKPKEFHSSSAHKIGE
jgi:hypothetical protein